jgi:hypothetical protein
VGVGDGFGAEVIKMNGSELGLCGSVAHADKNIAGAKSRIKKSFDDFIGGYKKKP